MFKLSTTCYLQSQELLNGLISGGRGGNHPCENNEE